MTLPPEFLTAHSARRAHIERMAEKAAFWAESPASQWCELAYLDALSFCIDADLEPEMDDLRHDLRIDREGYLLNDEGDRILGASRKYVPLKSLRECGAVVMEAAA